MRRFKSTLIDFIKKAVDYDKKAGIFENGDDNFYPEKQELLINNSVTAKQCAKTMATYVAGKGWGEDANNFIVNKKKGITLLQLTNRIAESITKQRGTFIHRNLNLAGESTSLDVLPFSHCRVGKKDDNDHNSKILVSKDWQELKENPSQSFDVYNTNKDVIVKQFEKDPKKYKGQILFENLDYNLIYPLSIIDAVQNDCDSEGQASIFKNRSLRKGFFGKQMVVTRPLVGAEPEEGATERAIADYNKELSEREGFKKMIQGFLGAENNDGILHIEMEVDDEEGLEKVILFKDVSANINDKLFQYTETSVANNIRFAFNLSLIHI